MERMPHRVICCLLICCSCPAFADQRALDIIRRAADSVVQAGDSYEVQIRVGTTHDDDDIGVVITSDCTLRRSGNRFQYEIEVSRIGLRSRLVTDGTDIWDYVAGWNQYTEDSLDSRRGAGLMKTVRDADFKFLRRFLLFSKPGFTASHEGKAVVRTRDGKHICDIVRVFPEQVQERSWEDRLWIDSATGLVRKSVMKRRVMDVNTKRPRTEIETVVWEHIALNCRIEDSVFRFVPPRGTELLEVLRPPSSPPQ